MPPTELSDKDLLKLVNLLDDEGDGNLEIDEIIAFGALNSERGSSAINFRSQRSLLMKIAWILWYRNSEIKAIHLFVLFFSRSKFFQFFFHSVFARGQSNKARGRSRNATSAKEWMLLRWRSRHQRSLTYGSPRTRRSCGTIAGTEVPPSP